MPSALLSDEVLISHFTEKEVGFHTWYRENTRAYHAASRDGKRAMLEKFCHNKEDQRAFRKWLIEWTGRHIERAIAPIEASDFVDLVCTTNTSDPLSLANFFHQMEFRTMPLVLLGERTFGSHINYALYPCVGYLWPPYEGKNEPGVSERILMAINTDVAIEYQDHTGTTSRKRSLECDFGEALVRPTNSNDINRAKTILFLQVGILYAYSGAISRNPEDLAWQRTGFAVVVRVNAQGDQIGVYIIYNFYHVDNESEELARHHISVSDRKGEPLPHIGRLNEEGEYFTIARIANSLKDLHPPRRFTVDIHERKECQIVRAKIIERGSDGSLAVIPQFVRRST